MSTAFSTVKPAAYSPRLIYHYLQRRAAAGKYAFATCNDGKDHWRDTSLRDANKCYGDIANQSGTLRCTALNREKR